MQTKDLTNHPHSEAPANLHTWKECKRAFSKAAAHSHWRLVSEKQEPHFSEGEQSGREAIKHWLSPLISKSLWPSTEEKPLSKDLALMAKVVASIVEAEESNILSEEEAEAVTRFFVSKFVERRFDKTLRELLNVSEKRWFLATSRYFHE